ncbi:MAG: histidine kinase [Actinomycetota bacterium]
MNADVATTPTVTAVERAAPRQWLSDAMLRRLGEMLSVFSILAGPTTLVLVARAGELSQGIENFTIINIETMIVYGVLGLVLIHVAPRNRLVWFFILVGVTTALNGMSSGVGELLALDQGVTFENVDTSGWLFGSAQLMAILNSAWVFGNFGLPTLGLLIAPDGHLPSRRWRPVAAAALLNLLAYWVLVAGNWPIRNGEPEAFADDTRRYAVMGVYLVLFAWIPLSYVSLVVRYRNSDPSTRRRLRWVLIGGGFVVASFFSLFLGGEILLLGFYPVLAIAFGLAIWRDQLFDVDRVISRTLVYASMLAAIAAIYVAVVFGLGAVVGGQLSDSPVIPLVATGVVAIPVQPLRRRFDKLAGRVVFGRRATPYEVLSEFTQRMAATDDQLLADVPRSVVDGTLVTAASVWALDDRAGDGSSLSLVSVWPAEQISITTAAVPPDPDDLAVPGADRTCPIRHDNHVVGALGLSFPAGETLPPADEALVTELVDGVGLALGNRELTGELRTRIDELRASRRRLVAVQDATRHRMERDLHDGAQQRLVAAKVRLSIAQQMAAKAEAAEVADELAALCAQADAAIESLRETARGIYSPVLASEGLLAALSTPVGRSPLTVDLTGALAARHGRDVEATAYFSILETLAAIERAGTDGVVTVAVSDDDGPLAFEVSAPAESEVGPLPAVEDRIDALGGTVRFGPSPTIVRAEIPNTVFDVDAMEHTPRKAVSA